MPDKKAPILSILIVSYNTQDLTLQTIHSVITNIAASSILKEKTELIIIDNNSQDDSILSVKKLLEKEVKAIFSAVHIIENKDNVGFAKANNQGIVKSKGTYILLLNSDTIVPTGDLEKLVAIFDSQKYPQLGMLAATLVNTDGTLQTQGGSLPSIVTLAAHMWFLDDIPLIGKVFSSTQRSNQTSLSTNEEIIFQGWVGGTAVMIPKEVIDYIGPLDEKIFMYGEDVEWCLRAKKQGFISAINTQSQITHLGSASSNSAHALKGEFTGLRYIFKTQFSHLESGLANFILFTGALFRMLVFGIMKPEKAQIYKEILMILSMKD